MIEGRDNSPERNEGGSCPWSWMGIGIYRFVVRLRMKAQ